MSRAVLILANDTVRARAMDWIRRAPEKTRVEFKEAKRSNEQSAKMWAMLTEIARQKEHGGKKRSADTWKLVFMHALGHEVEFIPSLDGDSFIPCNGRSSDLSKREMSDLIELITAWGVQNGVIFNDPQEKAA